ncbi:MAG: hypothetical protein A2289_12095 [Deltaproteobacteria bacterium RIFOXYA12_FULL_58_15]|nr:MAG: hypothetical protein A2289_12095 [Deltaproteobacteria bacterium RIFOXYA12_FULL_58_15]OGR08068.1 MAG: hypothetical protein A2341_03985 [Deltaproteobacteria bacterium RIFOXYB12_FULL_58_9]
MIRILVFPPEFEYLRDHLGPHTTAGVWALVPIAVVMAAAAFFLQLHLQARAARLFSGEKATWKQFEGLMISASVAQIPGLLAIFGSMLGARFTAVLIVVIVSTTAVVLLGVPLVRGGAIK